MKQENMRTDDEKDQQQTKQQSTLSILGYTQINTQTGALNCAADLDLSSEAQQEHKKLPIQYTVN